MGRAVTVVIPYLDHYCGPKEGKAVALALMQEGVQVVE